MLEDRPSLTAPPLASRATLQVNPLNPRIDAGASRIFFGPSLSARRTPILAFPDPRLLLRSGVVRIQNRDVDENFFKTGTEMPDGQYFTPSRQGVYTSFHFVYFKASSRKSSIASQERRSAFTSYAAPLELSLPASGFVKLWTAPP